MKKIALIFTILVCLDLPTAGAQYLSENALFQRCYMQLTNTRPKTKDSLTLDVKAGRKKAIDACVETLKRAQLTANGNQTISDTNDVVAKNILATFHHLHASWFYAKDFPVINFPGHNMDVKDLYDSGAPAAYITRALFKPSTPASSILTSTENLTPYRTNMDPAAASGTGHSKTDFVFSNFFVFGALGDLLGVKSTASQVVTFDASTNKASGLTSFDLYKTLGGGALGSQPYLLLNVGSLNSDIPYQYKTDGGVNMHRRWGKAVFHDFLCRELPVVRESDVAGLVSPTSSVPFRTSTACTKCHASHDRISGVIRGMNILYIGNGDPSAADRGGNFAKFHEVTQTAEASWPLDADTNYYQRPTNGVFYFRDYNGALINQNIVNVSDLGQKISMTDDFYICLAKRYYSYFTGIQADTGDLGDPAHTQVLGSENLKHRDIVISLGKKLKQTQSLQQLITDILNLDHYKKIDFGTRSGASVQ